MPRLLRLLTPCLVLVLLTAEATKAERQQFGESYGVLLNLPGSWTSATPDMNKQLGDLMRQKPGEYLVRPDPANPSETQFVFIRKLAGDVLSSADAIQQFCAAQRQKRDIDACGSFSFGPRKGLHVVYYRQGKWAAATYMLQLNEGVVIQFGIESPRESFPVLRQQMEIALSSLHYTQ